MSDDGTGSLNISAIKKIENILLKFEKEGSFSINIVKKISNKQVDQAPFQIFCTKVIHCSANFWNIAKLNKNKIFRVFMGWF